MQPVYPIHWLEGQVDEMINSTVSRNSDLPAYPIMRYVLSPDGCAESAYGEPPAAAARDAADEGPRTYEQALNLDLQYETDGKQTIANALAFRDEFAAMLQRGFRVIKHAPRRDGAGNARFEVASITLGVPRATVPEQASTRRERSER